ncbi:Permease of the major facilitator superfamily [Phaffia rhodozyma]|uniref:Permease of the major facilitator superfamily n=1 Tax=Phaffia rhodozyma TaxID=264483 RepID=A0A0F7SJI4_PHARH|nr:Permease of the major facilitator superfamily [Phaffia rhodozyma]
MSNVVPTLRREPTSQSSIEGSFYEKDGKAEVHHNEHLHPVEEGDEDGNVGNNAYLQSKDMDAITPEQNKRILRKVDWFILPFFLVTQTIQYLDKTALNYAKVFGMEKAMGLTGNQYSIAASIFYIGYMCAQAPFTYFIGRFPAGRVLGISCVLWGGAVLTMIANRSYSAVLANRFFLGALESATTPGLSLMTGFWYTRKEQPLRQTIWYSAIGWGGMIGALMAAGISGLSDSGPVKRWQLIFVILGVITVSWGFVIYFFLADGPSNARWLSKDDRILAVSRVATNSVGIKSTKFDTKQALAALIDVKTWCLVIGMFGSSVPNGILTNFSGPIITAMGFSQVNAALLDCAGRSLQIISLLIAGYVASRWDSCRIIMVTVGNIICVLGSALMAFLPFSQTWPRLIGFWLINCQSIGFTLGLVMISSNVGGYTKRSVTSTMVFIAYSVGNAVGPLFVYTHEKPVYRSAAYAMLASYGGKTVAHILLGVYMYYSNKKRDRVFGPADPQKAADLGMQGKTEHENPDFRYVL